MKIYVLIGLLTVGLFGICAQAVEAETIRLGYFEIRPHMYRSETTGQPAGAAVAHFETIARKMGCDVVWVGPLPHARLFQYLEAGTLIDGDPLMSKTSERVNFLYYPDTPFYLAKPNFVVAGNNPLQKIESADDVKGYVVGQFRKAANSQFVSANRSLFQFDIVSGGNRMIEQHLQKLLLGRIDAIHTLDEFTLLYEAKKAQMEDRIKVLFLPEPATPFYAVFCKNEKGKRLARKYDRAIRELGFSSTDYIGLIQQEFDRIKKE